MKQIAPPANDHKNNKFHWKVDCDKRYTTTPQYIPVQKSQGNIQRYHSCQLQIEQ
jgi:hypothetical protein